MIKKFLCTLILCCCLFCNELLNDLKINAASDEEEINTIGCYDSNTDNNNININYEKNNYSLTEEIVINITYHTFETLPVITYDTLGFTVTIENINVNGLTLKLVYNHLSLDPFVYININEEIVNIYGYIDNTYGIFISKLSFDDAAYLYLNYLFDNELIDENEYNNRFIEYNSRNIYINNSLYTNQINNLTNNNVNQLNSLNENNPLIIVCNFDWIDMNNVSHPVQFVRVDIKDANVDSDDVILDTIFLDEEGEGTIEIPNVIESDGTGLDIYIDISLWSADQDVHVRPDTLSLTYKISTKYIENGYFENYLNGGYLPFYLIFYMNSNFSKAMQIFNAAVISNMYAEEISGQDLSDIGIVYPSMDSECYYKSSINTIYMTNDSCGATTSTGNAIETYDLWDVVMHEYGHHIAAEFYLYDNPGGHHYIKVNMADYIYNNCSNGTCTKCSPTNNPRYGLTKEQCFDYGTRLAWGEGIATYLAFAAQEYYFDIIDDIYTVEEDERKYIYTAHDGGSVLFNEALDNISDDGCEQSIIEILINMLNINAIENDKDNLHERHSFMFWLLCGADSFTLYEFADFIYTSLPSMEEYLAEQLDKYKISSGNFSDITVTLNITPIFRGVARGSYRFFNQEHILKIYSLDNALILSKNLSNTSSYINLLYYSLTETEYNKVLKLTKGTKFKYQIESRHEYLPEGFYYKSEMIEIPLNIAVDNILVSTEKDENFTEENNVHWYKVIATSAGNCTFYTTGTLDTYIEVFDSIVMNNSIENRITFDDNSYDDVNAKVTFNINIGDTKYIRITEKNDIVGTYTLVASIPHVHEYVYTIANAILYPNKHTITCKTCDYFRVSAHYSSDGDRICDLCGGLVGEDDIIGGNILSADDDLINNNMFCIVNQKDEFKE